MSSFSGGKLKLPVYDIWEEENTTENSFNEVVKLKYKNRKDINPVARTDRDICCLFQHGSPKAELSSHCNKTKIEIN